MHGDSRGIGHHKNNYTRTLASNIVKGYKDTIKRRAPARWLRWDRTRRMRRVRRGCPRGEADVLVTQCGHAAGDGDSETEYHVMALAAGETDTSVKFEAPKGNTLNASRALRQAAIRMHVNTSHAAPLDLAETIRLAGGTEDAVEHAKALKCGTCERMAHPSLPRPASHAHAAREPAVQ